MSDIGKDLGNSADPKNIQDLTSFVQNLLQQMQDKFQIMSDQIITRITPDALTKAAIRRRLSKDPKSFSVIGWSADQVFALMFWFDDMGNRIDDLEKNIADLMTQAGVEDGRL